jgi:hypothetical protein
MIYVVRVQQSDGRITQVRIEKNIRTGRQEVNTMITHSGLREKITISCEKFDELTANLLEQTIAYTNKMLQEAEKKGTPTSMKSCWSEVQRACLKLLRD